MSSEFGKALHLSVFGESHGPAIGMVLDGLPAGEAVDFAALGAFLARRAPGRTRYATARQEADEPEFLSGLTGGRTNGAPLCAVIRNTNTRSSDYDKLLDTPRPSHADFTARQRYGGFHDMHGGGHFSGRLTAPLCIAGGVCLQLLARRGITVGAHLYSVGAVKDTPFDPVRADAAALRAAACAPFPVCDPAAGEQMRREIEEARKSLDSIGGIVECCAVGVPAGVGTPMFDGVENRLAAALFSIPGVRGVEFGAGFAAAQLRGSQHNDPFIVRDGRVQTASNRHGGILGGITSGMPVLFRVAFKPTPSIAQEQDTVSLSRHTAEKLSITGRHDPCIAVRAVPCVEAVAAYTLLDLLLSET